MHFLDHSSDEVKDVSGTDTPFGICRLRFTKRR